MRESRHGVRNRRIMTDAPSGRMPPSTDGRDAAASPPLTRKRSRAELSGIVRVRHRGREYAGWYRVAGDRLTLYCGVASHSGVVPALLPSPTPLAERLLRELIRAEHPGLDHA